MSNNEPFKPKNRNAQALKREELVKMLSEVSKKLYQRITADRFRERETDQTLLAFSRAFSQTAQALNSTLRDQELIELEDRIRELETKQQKEKVRCFE
jgi:hypothetical protein